MIIYDIFKYFVFRYCLFILSLGLGQLPRYRVERFLRRMKRAHKSFLLSTNSSHLTTKSSHLRNNSSRLTSKSSHLQNNSSRLTNNLFGLTENFSHLTNKSSRLTNNSSCLTVNSFHLTINYCRISKNNSFPPCTPDLYILIYIHNLNYFYVLCIGLNDVSIILRIVYLSSFAVNPTTANSGGVSVQ